MAILKIWTTETVAPEDGLFIEVAISAFLQEETADPRLIVSEVGLISFNLTTLLEPAKPEAPSLNYQQMFNLVEGDEWTYELPS